jgi:hypothetical protein
MKMNRVNSLTSVFLILSFVLSACGLSVAPPADTPAPTDTAQPTVTITLTPTKTPKPSSTPRPTKTPNLAATQRMAGFNTETQSYFDKGYLTTADGQIKEIKDFSDELAKINYYSWLPLGLNVSDFYISAHFKWSSAYRNADTSGCGVVFAVQENYDHYAIFLDKSSILFLNADQTASYSKPVGLTRGVGHVKFDNPADHPVEADFTLIVKGAYAYILVDGKVVGEYTLAQSKILKGDIGLSVISGTNKDYGTRCEMTNIHVWTPNK